MPDITPIYALGSSNDRLELSLNPGGLLKMQIRIPEEAKAGGTMVQKWQVSMTPEGPKVDLIT